MKPPPTLLDQLSSGLRGLAKYTLGVGHVSQNERKRRLSICHGCGDIEITALGERCRDCRCFLQPKTALQQQRCPQGKW